MTLKPDGSDFDHTDAPSGFLTGPMNYHDSEEIPVRFARLRVWLGVPSTKHRHRISWLSDAGGDAHQHIWGDQAHVHTQNLDSEYGRYSNRPFRPR